uniref:Uncharacterized protein n=1 Tax=Strigamia maritima TaxID=126957 RepID=T1IJ48_STRMM
MEKTLKICVKRSKYAYCLCLNDYEEKGDARILKCSTLNNFLHQMAEQHIPIYSYFVSPSIDHTVGAPTVIEDCIYRVLHYTCNLQGNSVHRLSNMLQMGMGNSHIHPPAESLQHVLPSLQ